MKVTDVSSHNGKYKFGSYGEDACIIKATGGTGYVNPYCDGVAQQMIANGKCWGIYHYAGDYCGGSAVAEADFFVRNIRGYLNVSNKPVLILDWEAGGNPNWGNGAWARDFIARVKEKTNIQCGIYSGGDGVAQTGKYLATSAWLWFAGYPTSANVGWSPSSFPYSIGAWKVLTGWQFSSNPLDKSLFYLDEKAWRKLAGGGSSTPAPNPTPQPPAWSTNGKSLETMATDVINGKVGSGAERAKRLGKYNKSVQAIVNERFKAISSSACHNILADEVINGTFGNGETRKFLLGTYYNTIQRVVNSRF